MAAKCFGAGRVIGIDNDPAAISVAKSNARLNKIRGASFQLGDVHKWNPAQKTDVITANLYSDLLIEILPKLRGGGWLILSGILRSQQDELVRALQRNYLDIISMKRRGKWMAILARRVEHSAAAGPSSRQIFAAVIDRRYSKNRCNLNSLLMPLSHPIRCGNRAPAASLAG